MDAPVGSVVTVPQGRGVVRFVGPTQFQVGKWIGIELYEANGKNDGSVSGVVYFTCKMNYGVFIRQSQLKAVHGMEEHPPVRSAVFAIKQNLMMLPAATSPAGSPTL
jgi:dynactin 1